MTNWDKLEGEGGENGRDYVDFRDYEEHQGLIDNAIKEKEEEEDGCDWFCWRWRKDVVLYWIKFAILCSCFGILALVLFNWLGPIIMDKELIPFINWETSAFTTPQLAVLLFVSVAIFPTLLLPSSPSIWVAGMTFGYGIGFLLVITAVAVGVSLPFFIGSLFHHKIEAWLNKYPKRATVLRAAGNGDWFHQFKAVILIRISPFPYIVYNYCAVATNVLYVPYFLGSLVGMVPDVFAGIYTGIIIRALADASSEQHSLSAPQIALNIVGFCVAVITTIMVTLYAKKELNSMQDE